MKTITTVEKARQRTYGGFLNIPYVEGRCVEFVNTVKDGSRQCSSREMSTLNTLYCPLHDPDLVVARTAEQDKGEAIQSYEFAAISLCNGVSLEEIQELGPGWLRRYLDSQ